MRYIEGILQPGESIVHTSKIHWIIYIPAIGILLLALLALTQAADSSAGAIWLLVSSGCAVVGGIWLFMAWFKRWTTEIDVTNRRIVYKRGFIRRHTVEMNMDKVESVDVDQSLFGRLLNYGDITIRGTGIGLEPLCGIAAPLDFRNHVTAR
ncbi:MAG: PH domain-containing protein [Pseudolabrys sp.]